MQQVFGLQTIVDKGRGLVTTQDVKAGQIVLQEEPLLLVLENAQRDNYCINCMKVLPQKGYMQCGNCQYASFCSPQCQNTLTHSNSMCQAYNLIKQQIHNLGEDTANTLMLLLQVQQQINSGNAGLMERLCYIAKGNTQNLMLKAMQFRQLIEHIYQNINFGQPLFQDQIHDILKVEQSSTFGIMVNYQLQSERYATRGSAIYMTTSLINHECVPNLARFESFDNTPEGCTSDYTIKLVAMHDLPKGTELLISYLPLGWDYKTRQDQLQNQFGFSCNCPRCLTESVMDAYDDMESNNTQYNDHNNKSTSNGMVQNENIEQFLPEGALDPSYLQVYMMKYLCPITEDCDGTLAPILGTDKYLCSICNGQRSEADFMADFEYQNQ